MNVAQSVRDELRAAGVEVDGGGGELGSGGGGGADAGLPLHLFDHVGDSEDAALLAHFGAGYAADACVVSRVPPRARALRRGAGGAASGSEWVPVDVLSRHAPDNRFCVVWRPERHEYGDAALRRDGAAVAAAAVAAPGGRAPCGCSLSAAAAAVGSGSRGGCSAAANESADAIVSRLELCFDTEDPRDFVRRVAAASAARRKAVDGACRPHARVLHAPQ
jgi:hypothetical protein